MQDNEYNCNVKLAHQAPTKPEVVIEYIQDDEKSEKLDIF